MSANVHHMNRRGEEKDYSRIAAIAISIVLHIAVFAFVAWGHIVEPPQEPHVKSVKVQMVMMPVPNKPIVAEPEVVPPKPVHQPKPKPKAKPEPVIKEAKFAKKRVDDKKPPEPPIEPEVIEEAVEEAVKEPLPETPVKEAMTEQVDPLPNQLDDASLSNETTDKTASTATEKPFDINQYQPVSKRAPAYPERALNKNIEGICTVQYTVNEQGRVESLKALDDCHPYFIKASLTAAKGFQYQPRIVNGAPVKVPNVKNAFHYKIE